MSHLTHFSHFPHIAARWLRFPARHSGGMFGGNSTLSDEVMSQGTVSRELRGGSTPMMTEMNPATARKGVSDGRHIAVAMKEASACVSQPLTKSSAYCAHPYRVIGRSKIALPFQQIQRG
ncbi:hypothetical protein [Pectobacterium sp. A5351]|uniref:hypothetical protein n=1 Tax=Pectobacterium sp. A5351 TaxID=2914983 RepID=UPI00232C9A1B|nr:hypothetical protein [Pectobacterium sp. A5351]WCG83448.1 hypothetical protein O1Q74_01665 [Pectobacterium sp. A5351]